MQSLVQNETHEDMLAALGAALSLEGTAVIVRAPGAIAEITGPLALRAGEQWLTLGQEGSSHLHLRTADVAGLRFTAAPDANAALEVLGTDGAMLCRVSFRRTNAQKAERYDAPFAATVSERFGHLRGR